jgi:hypothetical protein
MARPNALTLSSHAMDLVSAALRHVRDAEHLLHAGADASPDQAYHLAAFGPECARKSTLSIRWLDLAIGHSVDTVAEDILGFVISIDPIALRYDPMEYGARYPKLKEWNVDCRYKRTGSHTPADAETLCREARAAVDGVVLALWADGRMPDGGALW